MRHLIAASAAASLLFVAQSQAAVLLAGFTFNAGVSSGTEVVLPYNAEFGLFPASVNSNALPANVKHFTGRTENQIGNEPAGNDFAVEGGPALPAGGWSNDGRFIDWDFQTTGHENLGVSFVGRRTSNGPTSVTLSFSTDGGTTFVPGGTIDLTAVLAPATAWVVTSIPFPSLLDDQTTAKVRMTLNGFGSASGNLRLDNVQITGTLIPEPASLSLLGLAGLALRRRRQ